MKRMLIIGDFQEPKQLKYSIYLINEFCDKYDICVSGTNIDLIKDEIHEVNYSGLVEDLYAYYVFSASTVIILKVNINYHKYKRNQRVIYFEQNDVSKKIKEDSLNPYINYSYMTDCILFNSNNKIEKKMGVNLYNYKSSFNDSNVKNVIDTLKIAPTFKHFENDVLVLITNPFFRNRNNFHNLVKKIDLEYESYNIIGFTLNVRDAISSIGLNGYTAIINKNDPNVLKYLKFFDGIVVYGELDTLNQFKFFLNYQNIRIDFKKMILEEKTKLFFDKSNIQNYLLEIDNKKPLSVNDYVNCLDNMYNVDIKSKKISVIICTYNTPSKLLFRYINSAFESTHKNLEIIVIDDGSNFNISQELNERFKHKNIQYYYQENIGLGLSRNAGVKKSTGDYIFFLDSDDTITKYGLQYMLTHAMIFDLDLVIGKRLICDENGRFLSESFKQISSTTYNCYCNCYQNPAYYDSMATNKLLRSKAFDKYDIWFKSGLYEDTPFAAAIHSRIPEYHYLNVHIYNWYKYGNETTISSISSYQNFSQRAIATEEAWEIIPEFMKGLILTIHIQSFCLYFPSFLKYSAEEKRNFFDNCKDYVTPKLAYYKEDKNDVTLSLLIRCLKNDDYDSFSLVCSDYASKITVSDIVHDNYICHTHYHIYVSIIRSFNNKRPSRLFIRKGYETFTDSFVKKIKLLNLFTEVIEFTDGNVVSILEHDLNCRIFDPKSVIETTLYQNFHPPFANCNPDDHVYIYNDILPYWYFVERYFQNIIKIEDAYNSFKWEVELEPYFGVWGGIILKYSKILPKTKGLSDKITTIVISEPITDKEISEKYKNKFLVSNIKSIESKFKSELYEIMNKIYNIEDIFTEDKIMIMTQPLYNYYCSKEDQIKLYDIIASKNSKDKIVIKPHPADRIDYKELGYNTADKNIPIEVYNLSPVKVKKAITLFSTAIYTINFATEKEILFKMDGFENSEVSLAIKTIINDSKTKMKIGCIIQARNTSTRLPRKVLMPLPLAIGPAVLEHVIKRVRKVNFIEEVIVATTVNKVDDSIEDLALELGVKSFRGSETDVLSRYYEAATQNGLDIIIRITSDCPCIDYEVLQGLIKFHLLNKNDYSSNAFIRTFPHGLDAEVINYCALKEAYHNATDQFDIEHVTPYIYRTNREKFKIGNYENKLTPKSSKIRITLDTEEDYMALNAVFEHFKEKPNFLLQDIVDLYNEKPWLYLINNNVVQKQKYDSLESELNAAVEILRVQELSSAAKVLENHSLGVCSNDKNTN